MEDKHDISLSKQVSGFNVLNELENCANGKKDNNNKHIITRKRKYCVGEKREVTPRRNPHLVLHQQTCNV